MKSKVPKKAATATQTPITIKVCLMVSCLVGQFTFFISSWTSFKKVTILLGMFIKFMVFKKPHRASFLMVTKQRNRVKSS